MTACDSGLVLALRPSPLTVYQNRGWLVVMLVITFPLMLICRAKVRGKATKGKKTRKEQRRGNGVRIM